MDPDIQQLPSRLAIKHKLGKERVCPRDVVNARTLDEHSGVVDEAHASWQVRQAEDVRTPSRSIDQPTIRGRYARKSSARSEYLGTRLSSLADIASAGWSLIPLVIRGTDFHLAHDLSSKFLFSEVGDHWIGLREASRIVGRLRWGELWVSKLLGVSCEKYMEKRDKLGSDIWWVGLLVSKNTCVTRSLLSVLCVLPKL